MALGLLEHLQLWVALEPFSEGGSSFGTEVVASQPASAGKEAGAEKSVNGR